MARIGNIYIGGKNTPSEIFNSGVAFTLKSDSELDHTYYFDNKNWEVEIKKNQNSIVARCKHILSDEEILQMGFDYCQRFLDLISIQKHVFMHTTQPGDKYTLLVNKNDEYCLRRVDLSTIESQIEVTIVHKDKDGNIIPEPSQLQQEWKLAFRYYRLSQLSSDIYEAYRNLFLAFEYTLNQLCPKNSRENETKWFKRALNFVNDSVDLSNLVPDEINDSVAFIVGKQYEYLRCSLFHSKSKIILPHENRDPTEITEEYERLLHLWKEIIREHFGINNHGSLITYAGQKSILNGLFCEGFDIQFTDDSTPASPCDRFVSPANHAVYSFSELNYDNTSRQDQDTLIGRISNKDQNDLKAIYRIAIKIKNKLFSIDYIKDGLLIDGIDVFETYQSFRIVNKNVPKTDFK